jgi:pimeloyl-ACP methyl ester carboxylesterase
MKASINGIKIAFDDLGRGPAVILIHGFPFNRKMWAPQISSLTENGFRVIAPDLRGFGESEAGEDAFNIRTFSDDIARLMTHLGIGRAVMVGMSLGGEVVLDLLERYPRKVVATSILAPALPPADAEEQIRYLNFAELVQEGHHQTALDGLCQWIFPGQQTEAKLAMIESVRELMESVDLNTLARGMAFCARQKNWVENGEPHNIPSLVLTGALDKLSPPKRNEILARLLPKGRLKIFSEAGHMLNLEAARDLNQYLLNFLEELCNCRPRHFQLAGIA